MDAGQAAEVGSSLTAGHCAFPVARDGWGVIAEGGYCVLSDVVGVGDDIQVCCHTCLFQVAVGDVACGIVVGHDSFLEVLRKGATPEVWFT